MTTSNGFFACLMACLLSVSCAWAQPSLPVWPADTAYFLHSTYFEVSVSQGFSNNYQPVEVLMSLSQDEKIRTYSNGFNKNRTFSYAPFSFDPTDGPVFVRVRQLTFSDTLSTNASNTELIGHSGGKQKIDAQTVVFRLDNPGYVSVFFDLPENVRTSNNGQFWVIKHMLMIFADPLDNDLNEPDAGVGENKVIYSATTTPAQLRNADLIVFRPGYHDVHGRWGLDGLTVTSGTRVWLAAGAVLDGVIRGTDLQGNTATVSDLLVYGRGIQFLGNHRNNPANPTVGPYWILGQNNSHLPDMIGTNGGQRNQVRGIIMADIFFHGVVSGREATIDRVKIWGWHYNCDGFRPGMESEVKNSFIRACDDALYAFKIQVSNVVFWQSFNGAVVTCGWGGGGDYSTGGLVMNNCTLIYPEWTGKGNNNGLIASQLNNKQICTGAEINGLDIYGDPIALLNLKPYSNAAAVGGSGGSITGIRLRNVRVYGNQMEPSRVESSTDFRVQDIVLENVRIDGFAARNLNNDDRSNISLFEGNNLTNNAYLNILDTSVSLKDDTPASPYRLYPNPGHHSLRIEGWQGYESLELFDTTGRQYEIPASQADISIEDLPPGLYYLRIDGRYCLRFIKK